MDWGAFWGAFLATGIVGGILTIGLKFLLDSQLERQKKELAQELFKAEIITRISIESQIEGIDALLEHVLSFRDSVSDYLDGVRELKPQIPTIEKSVENDLALSVNDPNHRKVIAENVEKIILSKIEIVHDKFLEPLVYFTNAFSFARARMTKEQIEELNRLHLGIISELARGTNKGDPLKVLHELREYLESESRRLRGIEKSG